MRFSFVPAAGRDDERDDNLARLQRCGRKMRILNGMCTLVVLIGGGHGRRIVRLAQEHADFDPLGRRVVGLEEPVFQGNCSSNCVTAAIVVNAEGAICAILDARQAMTEAWIEDAFVRAKRATGTLLPASR